MAAEGGGAALPDGRHHAALRRREGGLDLPGRFGHRAVRRPGRACRATQRRWPLTPIGSARGVVPWGSGTTRGLAAPAARCVEVGWFYGLLVVCPRNGLTSLSVADNTAKPADCRAPIGGRCVARAEAEVSNCSSDTPLAVRGESLSWRDRHGRSRALHWPEWRWGRPGTVGHNNRCGWRLRTCPRAAGIRSMSA